MESTTTSSIYNKDRSETIDVEAAFKEKCRHMRANREGRNAEEIYQNLVQRPVEKVDTRPPMCDACNVKPEKLDSIRSGDSLFKMFIFEPTVHTDETEKCIAFWDYIRAREDLKPLDCTLVKGKAERNKAKKESQTVEEPPNPNWTEALLELKKRKLDKLAMMSTLPVCKLCDDQLSLQDMLEEQMLRNQEEKADIIALNDWDPHRKIFADISMQTSNIFKDGFNENQDTASFISMAEANKPPEYIEMGTDLQNSESLLHVTSETSSFIPEAESEEMVYKMGEEEVECYCPTCEYNLQEPCWKGSEPDIFNSIICPYRKSVCSCGMSTDTVTCPYLNTVCTCKSDSVEFSPEEEKEVEIEPCPYKHEECVCGAMDEPEHEVCPYQVESCTCGVEQTEESSAPDIESICSNPDCQCEEDLTIENEDVKSADTEYSCDNPLCVCEGIPEKWELITPAEHASKTTQEAPQDVPAAGGDTKVDEAEAQPLEEILKPKIRKRRHLSVGTQASLTSVEIKHVNNNCMICGNRNCTCEIKPEE